MVVFVLAVGNKKAYKDYETVEKHLLLTLTCLQQQNSDKYKVVVVSNELPSFDLDGKMADYHLVDFVPPQAEKFHIQSYEGKDYNLFKIDKGCRLTSGLLYAQKYTPDYAFFLDCDDWVNINVAQYLNENATEDVVCADKGNFVQFQSKTYKNRRGLVRYCGSTIAYKNTFLFSQFPALNQLNENSPKSEIISSLSDLVIAEIFGNHVMWFDLVKSGELSYATFPFFASCWVTGTGANVSGTNYQSDGLIMDDTFLDTFGLSTVMQPSKHNDSLIMKLKHKLAYIKSFYEWKKSEMLKVFCYK